MSITRPDNTLALARLARKLEIEAAQQLESIDAALAIAVEAKDEDTAASIARMKRDKLLQEVDKHGSIFRLSLAKPTGSTFTSFLPWLKQLAEILTGSTWAKYRQQLLDVPQQSGFPYVIDWPAAPESDDIAHGTEDGHE